MGIERLGSVQVRVTDMDVALAYYTTVLGLKQVERDGDRVYLKAWDEHDHHSLVLRAAATPGLDHMSWKLETAADLEQSRRGQVEKIPAIEGRAHGSRLGAPRQQTQQGQHRQRLAGS